MAQLLTREEFKQKYNQYRQDVYDLVPARLGIPGAKLTPITGRALMAQKKWPSNDRVPPNGGWDWNIWTQYFKQRHKKYFDVALWYENELCGLALGRLSRKNVNVKLELVEGSTDKVHPLKGQVALTMLTAIEAFGAIAGAEESLIIDPVPGAIPAYQRIGYSLRQASKHFPVHLVKRL